MALAAALLFACPAHAQTHFASSPTSGWVDGLGGIQVRLDGSSAGEFAPDSEQPAHAGLAIAQNGIYSPVGDTNREAIKPPAVTNPTATTTAATSQYKVGALIVDEQALLTEGNAELKLTYGLTNAGNTPLQVHAAEIGDLPRLARAEADTGFVGATDQLGRRTGLVPGTPWNHYDAGPDTFKHMQDTQRLSDTIATGFQNQTVGAEWESTIAPGGHADISVTWTFTLAVATINVTTVADHDDGVCDLIDCTLREALIYAPSDTTINLAPGTYKVTGHELTSDHDDVTIVGRDARRTIIDGADKVRVLE